MSAQWVSRGTPRLLVAVALLAAVAGSGTNAAALPTSSSVHAARSALQAALRSARAEVGAPAATAAIMECGELVWSGASGVIDVVERRPVERSTLFVPASTTKTLTATMIMRLVEGGLSLGSRLSRFYPELPRAREITIRMLLNHTSGLPEYFDHPRIARIIDNQPEHHWTRAEIIQALSEMNARFPPGTRFSYTNSNYVVLGGIIEQVSDSTLEAHFQQAIAGPAGMTRSTFVYEPSRSEEFAHPYEERRDGSLRDWFVPGLGISSDYWGEVWTDGGVASTALDLARFGDALFDGRLVQTSSLEEMTDMGRFDYGLGIYDRQAEGHRWLGHDGAYGGYESENWTDPSRGLTVAVTTNLTERPNAGYFASDVIWRALVRAHDRTATPTGC